MVRTEAVVPLLRGGDMIAALYRASHVLQVGSYWMQLLESTRQVLSRRLVTSCWPLWLFANLRPAVVIGDRALLGT